MFGKLQDDDEEADDTVQMYDYGKRSRSKCNSNPGRVLDTSKIMERIFDIEGGRILLKVSTHVGSISVYSDMSCFNKK